VAVTEIADQQKITEQEKYSHDKIFYLILSILLALGLVTSVLGMMYLFNLAANPAPTYFQATDQGGLISEVPLENSNMETNVLLNWVTEGMMRANTFNFINYPTVLDNARVYFTKEGYDSYTNALTNAKITDRVIQKKLVLHAVPSDAPQVLLEKPFAGRYMWKIRAPMNFSYQSVTDDHAEPMEITLIVMRVPTTESENGVLILKYDLTLTNS
jgi:hypothetical protein